MAHILDDRSSSGHILWVPHDTMDDARDWPPESDPIRLEWGDVGPLCTIGDQRRPAYWESNPIDASDEWMPDPDMRGHGRDATRIAWGMAVEGLYLPDIPTLNAPRRPLNPYDDLERTCDYPVCMNLAHLQHIPRLPAPQRILELIERPGEDTTDDLRSLPPNQQPCWLWVGPVDGIGKPTATFYGRARSGAWWVWMAIKGGYDSLAYRDIARQSWCPTELCVNPAHHRETTKGGARPGAGRPPARWCKHGHVYAPENTGYILRPDGSVRSKFCKTCIQARHPSVSPQRSAASRNFPGIIGDDSLLGEPTLPIIVGQGVTLRGDETILELEEME